MTTEQKARTVVLAAGEGKALTNPIGAPMAILARAEDTGGAYSLLWSEQPTGAPPVPMHIHRKEEEAFYILEGELEIRVGGRTVRATAGSYVLVPRGVAQAFTNPGMQTARFLTIFTPGGGEGFFEEADALFRAAPDGLPDHEQLGALSQKYQIEYL